MDARPAWGEAGGGSVEGRGECGELLQHALVLLVHTYVRRCASLPCPTWVLRYLKKNQPSGSVGFEEVWGGQLGRSDERANMCVWYEWSYVPCHGPSLKGTRLIT